MILFADARTFRRQAIPPAAPQGEIHVAAQVGMGSRSATLPVTRAGTFSRRATPVARSAQAYRSRARERFPDGQRRSRGSATLPVTRAGTLSRRATPVAQPYRSHARKRFPDGQRRSRGSATLRAPESAHQQWGGSPHRTEHWLSVVEGNCVVERRGGKQPETNCQSINKAMLNTIRPDALASLRRVSEA